MKDQVNREGVRPEPKSNSQFLDKESRTSAARPIQQRHTCEKHNGYQMEALPHVVSNNWPFPGPNHMTLPSLRFHFSYRLPNKEFFFHRSGGKMDILVFKFILNISLFRQSTFYHHCISVFTHFCSEWDRACMYVCVCVCVCACVRACVRA